MMTLPRLLRIASPSLFVAIWFASAVMGQTETATVSGLVTDRTAAAVSGAEVRLQSVERGTVTTATTNNAGIYVFPSVQPGQYQISIQKQGFKQVDLLGLVVNVQDHIEQNFRLEVGSVAESVTVEAGASMINTTDASVSTVVDQAYVKNMPLNGRSFQDLILLTPGAVTQTPQPSSSSSVLGATTGLGQSGEFSVNGQRPEANYYTVDGVSANIGAAAGQNMIQGAGPSGSVPAATALGTTQALVSVDALQEFRVQSSTYSAEYGRNPGGQFTFETKSGTNQLHGTAYDYFRNDYFDANDWFNDYLRSVEPTLTKPALRQNDFGGTLGGPVRIPHLYNGKDKTFFFVSYEGLRLVSPQPACATCFVPDATLRANAPAPLNQVLNAFPVSNGPEVLVPCNPASDPTCPLTGLKQDGLAQYIASWSNPSSLNSTGVRFDHVLNEKLRFFFRFGNSTSNSSTRGTPGAASVTTTAYTTRTYTGGISSLFSSRLSNDFRLNYSSNDTNFAISTEAFGGGTPFNLAQFLGLGPGSNVAVLSFYDGHPVTLSQQRQFGAQRQWNILESASVSVGRHQFKFGIDYRRLAPVESRFDGFASYFYSSESAIENNRARVRTASSVPAYPLYTNFSAFAQDEWRVSRRLSLSLGLRWEVNPAPSVTQGRAPYTVQGTSPTTFALAPKGTPLWKTTWFNFAPRLGAAYVLHSTPGRETVVRSGVGVFFDTGQQMGSLGFLGPGFNASTAASGSFPVLPAMPVVVDPPVFPYANSIFGYGSHLQLPYTLEWNATIEQGLGKSQAFTLTYVGAHASRLLQLNQLGPNANNNRSFYITTNGLSSDFDSVQVQFRRRLTQGLAVLGSYTWSHCLDYGSENYVFGYQHGNCDFDVRNNLSAAFSYDLRDVGHSAFAKAVLHHWGLDDRFTARTGFPVTLLGNILQQPDGQFYFGGLSFVPGQSVYLYGANCASVLQGLGSLQPGQGCPGGRVINPNAFVAVNSGFGNAPRNFARGFGAWQMDLAVRRDFPIKERLRLQFRVEAFNIFNHPNFGTIDPNFGSSTFGQAQATLASSLGILSPLYQMGGPRSMQFALKLTF